MKFEVTLKQLRDNKACVDGYNRVVCALKDVPYAERTSYMSFNYSEPIPLTFILESNGLFDMLWCLRCNKDWDKDTQKSFLKCVMMERSGKNERI